MSQYRLYIKSVTNLGGRSVESSETRVIKATIRRDLTTKVSSSIEVLNIPNAIIIGDIVGIRDASGRTVYQGVVKSFNLSNNTIDCNQLISLLDFTFLYKYSDYTATNIEDNLLQLLDKIKASSELMNQALGSIDFTKGTETSGKILKTDDKEYITFNAMSKIIEFYANYDVVLDMNIGFGENRGTGLIKRYDNDIKNIIKDNVSAVRNVSITKEEANVNTLHINNKLGNIIASFYVKNDGSVVDYDGFDDRPHILKVKYVSTEKTDQATIDGIKAENLPDESLNHCITMELLFNNKMFDFYSFELGSWYELWLQGKHFYSALTGYNYTINNNGNVEKATLTFGKVRQSLESRLFKNAG